VSRRLRRRAGRPPAAARRSTCTRSAPTCAPSAQARAPPRAAARWRSSLVSGVVVPPLPEPARLADGSGWRAAPRGGPLAEQPGWAEGGEGAARAVCAFTAAVCAHPLLRDCPQLDSFLDPGRLPSPPPRAASVGEAAAGEAEAGSLTAWLLDSFADSLAAAAPPLAAEARRGGQLLDAAAAAAAAAAEAAAAAAPGSLSADGAVLAEAGAYLTALREGLEGLALHVGAAAAAQRAVAQALSLMHASAAALCAAQLDLAAASAAAAAEGEAGERFASPRRRLSDAAAEAPPTEDGLGAALVSVAAAAADAAAPASDSAAALEAGAAEPLRAAAALAGAGLEVLAGRRRAQQGVARAEAAHAEALEAAAAAHAAAQGEEGTRAAARAAEAAVAAAAEELLSQRARFDALAGRVAAELPRVHAELCRDARLSLAGFAAAQAGAGEAQAAAWGRVLPGSERCAAPVRPA